MCERGKIGIGEDAFARHPVGEGEVGEGGGEVGKVVKFVGEYNKVGELVEVKKSGKAIPSRHEMGQRGGKGGKCALGANPQGKMSERAR